MVARTLAACLLTVWAAAGSFQKSGAAVCSSNRASSARLSSICKNEKASSTRPAAFSSSFCKSFSSIYKLAPWHFLNFLPLPQGHGSLRPTLA